MAKYQKVETTGSWVKSAEVVSGTKCKLMSETVPSVGMYEGKEIKNNVSKIRFQGEKEGEERNVNVNRPSINALVDAFGEDSKDWIGKVLTAHTEKMLVGGKRVTALYLVPDGYVVTEDAAGYVVIQPKLKKPAVLGGDTRSPEAIEEGINPDDIPF